MIELYNISKTYSNKKKVESQVIVNATGYIPENETIFLLGPSGSGKTTLLNIIAALDQFDEGGSLVVNGQTINELKKNPTRPL